MTWVPDLTVTIGGTTYTSHVVDAVQVSYGRTNVWEQPRTGYATIQLIQLTESYWDIEINSTVVITMENSSGVAKTIFTGTVNNVESRRAAQGSIGGTTLHTISAVGPFAKMSRTDIGGTDYPKEYDDDRMTAILTDAGVTIDTIDTPGIYEFAKRDPLVVDAYTLAASTASQAFGYIYETTAGEVGYANQSRRLNEVQDNGYFQIPQSYIQWSQFATSRNLGNLLNSITVDYASGFVTASEPASIALYGLAAGKVTTSLHGSADAQALADFFIATRAVPQTNIASFSIQLDSSLLTNADRNTLIETYLGKPILITSLPSSLYNNGYIGFVEGWQLSANRLQASITLTTTDSTFSIVPTRWQDVDPAQEWQDVAGTIRWFEYE